MQSAVNVLILGASYGSLLATKVLLAGHAAKLICLPAEADLINREGTRVLTPVKGRDGLTELDSRTLPGKLSAGGPADADPSEFDLVVLAMQEPQYRAPGVRELLDRIAKAGVPCMSIMNMPPPPYLKRIPAIPAGPCRPCYTDASVWDGFDPKLMTLCSPDAQAFRPAEEKVNVLQVRLPTNFKAARFASDAHTAMLREIEAGIEAARYDSPQGRVELPVKLKVHESVYVPLAKWSMLLAGNYRCVGPDGMRSIRDAVHGDLVPFEKYANAALSLLNPSSAARALAAGAPNIERVDRLVQALGAQKHMRSDAIDAVVANVDRWIARNRSQSAAPAAR